MTESPDIQPIDPEVWGLGGWKLGATFNPEKNITSFAVYAPDATRVVLEIYAASLGEDAVFHCDALKGEDGCWRAQLSNAGHGTLYGYRVWGRNWMPDDEWQPGSQAGFTADRDEDGNHFNPNKLLTDPYALEITHVPYSPMLETDWEVDRGIFGTGPGQWRDQEVRLVDTGKYAPKSVVIVDDGDTGRRPDHATEDTSIYEAHVKNITMHPSSVKLGDLLHAESGFEAVRNIPDELRGTYAGAAYLAPYLQGLGMNTIELLPVHETDSDQIGQHNGTTNHWGYQTIGFFAPNRDYSSDKAPGGPTREFKQMVKTFHEHGIEVYLDVVYNHTGEGGNWNGDPDSAGFFCFGGFATTHYYDLSPEGFIVDGASGSSNQTNFSRRVMCNLVLDSLEYWHATMGVDGFRFDLATVLGRFSPETEEPEGDGRKRFYNSHPLLREVAAMADDKGFEVIAEAWDLWGYEVGNFPSGWGEWNGRFRDAVRRYLKGTGDAKSFMDQFNGDWLHFNDNGGPQKSINFVTAHDGFTMFDLVSFNEKENDQEYPFGPSDGGSDSNESWDTGGDKPLRRARWRNLFLTTFFARGVPMIVSGDEYGRTQNGNNNPWSLNTVGIWNNWAQLASRTPTLLPVDPTQPDVRGYYDVVGECDSDEDVNPMFRFARYVARLRRLDPTLRQRIWGDLTAGNDNVSYLYYGPDAQSEPGDRLMTVLINGAEIGGTDYLLMINMTAENQDFIVPKEPDPARPDLEWHRIIDTAAWAEHHNNTWRPADGDIITESYDVQPWSIAVLAAANDSSPLFHDSVFH